VRVPALASKRRPQPAIRAQRSCCAPFEVIEEEEGRLTVINKLACAPHSDG
jgi:hypothetical protein